MKRKVLVQKECLLRKFCIVPEDCNLGQVGKTKIERNGQLDKDFTPKVTSWYKVDHRVIFSSFLSLKILPETDAIYVDVERSSMMNT